jgi:potassium-transporting ATPase KdpC subunit
MTTILRPACILFFALTLVTGIAYPTLVTGVAQVLFQDAANGQLLEVDGKPIGSQWIGQQWSSDQWFWGRPSATAPMPYNAVASGGSNLGPRNPTLIAAARARVATLRAAHPDRLGPIPADLVYASGSGLDPHISIAAAHFQAGRVATANGLPEAQVFRLIEQHTEAPFLGRVGVPYVNVLLLNRALIAKVAR